MKRFEDNSWSIYRISSEFGKAGDDSTGNTPSYPNFEESKDARQSTSFISDNNLDLYETLSDEATPFYEQLLDQPLHKETSREVNILLLGETGVGKSTFINAFVNYLHYDSLREAELKDLLHLIPSNFVVTDENFEFQTQIKVGNCSNESQIHGQSATQKPKSYIFNVGRFKIRLIDTPGIGDTRGIEKDGENCENILSYISEFDELHAICILLKPNNARLTITFEYCIKQLLSKLEKSASNNIIFIYTNSRSTLYRPGDTQQALREILNQVRSTIPHLTIPFGKNNVFCMDNEAFRFLAAVKQSVVFAKEKPCFEKSWERSSGECWRLLRYIAGSDSERGLPPHKIQQTVSINEARRQILRLHRPLADIAQVIEHNVSLLKAHIEILKDSSQDLRTLRSELCTPIVQLVVKKLDQPRTICTSSKCSQKHVVNGKETHLNRTKICHDPCSLSNVTGEIVGAKQLLQCHIFKKKKCLNCGCSYKKHMHIYYQTEAVQSKVVDKIVESKLHATLHYHQQTEQKISITRQRTSEFINERKKITKTIAKFACFLQNHAMTVYNDAYQYYLEFLIDQENSTTGTENYQKQLRLQQLLEEYKKEKQFLFNCISHSHKSSNLQTIITPQDIHDSIKELHNLKHSGSKIKEMYDAQNQAKSRELKAEQEVNHETTFVEAKFVTGI